MKSESKAGRLTESEKGFILQNYEKMSVVDIAGHLNKNRKTIAAFIKKSISNPQLIEKGEDVNYSINKSPVWKEIKQQLSTEEIETFLYYWNNIHLQF
jgi:IS30 family transposase